MDEKKATLKVDSAAQRLRALELMRTGPKSTIQLRRDGDILQPAARIFELKARGYEIVTHWVQQATDCGTLHRVALYALMRESGGTA
jgi:Helix-turn-helix domain